MLNPRQVIGWKSKVSGGKVVLTDLRIKEVIVVDGDDFGQTKVEQIRHIMPGKVEITVAIKAMKAAHRGLFTKSGKRAVVISAGNALHEAHRVYAWFSAAAQSGVAEHQALAEPERAGQHPSRCSRADAGGYGLGEGRN
jgi:hypothetical protein